MATQSCSTPGSTMRTASAASSPKRLPPACEDGIEAGDTVQLAPQLSAIVDGPCLTFHARGHKVTFRREGGLAGLAELAERFRMPKTIGHAIPKPTSRALSDIAALRRHGVIIDASIGPMAGGRA